jgi:uncharacterized membrane protein YcaP (DUF421 family)
VMEIVIRSAALYLFVFLVTRAMGRKELGQLSSFELILLVVMGDLIQQGVTGDDRSVVGAMLAVTTFALLTVAISFAAFRWRRTEPLLEGIPVVVIRDGKPLDEVLRVERLTLEELKDAAREQGVADLSQVRVGILEAEGRFSFLRTGDQRSPGDERRNS